MHEENNDSSQLDLTDLWQRFYKCLRRFFPLVIVLALLCSGIWYFRAKNSFYDQYEAKARFSVSSGYSANDIFSSSYYDNYAAQQLASAFPNILRTDLMRDLMLQQLDKTYINGTINASSVADTNMFVLTVTSSSAQDAYDILCAVIDCYPQVAVYMVDNPQVVVLQAPSVPTSPINSFSGRNALIKGAVIGAVLGLAVVAVLSWMTRTVSTEDQLKAVVNLPVLAVLPKVTPKTRRSNKRPVVTAAVDRGMAEALRGFALKIRKMGQTKPNKVILMTSTLSGEGKTTVASNLAIALARDGHKVALLDADFRNQSIAHQLGVASTRANLLDCLGDSQHSVLDSMAFAPNSDLAYLSGNSTGDAHYSIDARQLKRILQELTGEFEYVILDAAPCAVVADATLLCHAVDSVIYVVKPDYARQSKIVDAVNSLYEKDAPLTGFVLNGVDRSYNHYGYGYKYGYGSKYGYGGYGKKKRRSTTK